MLVSEQPSDYWIYYVIMNGITSLEWGATTDMIIVQSFLQMIIINSQNLDIEWSSWELLNYTFLYLTVIWSPSTNF